MRKTPRQFGAAALCLSICVGGLVTSLRVRPLPALVPPAAPGRPAAPSRLAFEPNVGQADGAVHYLSRGPGYAVFLAPSEAVLALAPRRSGGRMPGRVAPPAVVRMRVAGARADTVLTPGPALAGRVNYLRGADPRQWRVNVPTHESVTARQVYPGIDAVFYGSPSDLEYDFVVAPGADPGLVALDFTDLAGAPLQVAVDTDGHLQFAGEITGARMERPRVYQDIDGVRRTVEGAYALDRAGGRTLVRFELGAYDPAYALVIDPVLAYSSFLGGSGADLAYAAAADSAGNTYLAGTTLSSDFPVVNALQGAGTFEAFVSKVSPSGALVFSTYLGGNDRSEGRGIAVDAAGLPYVTGFTRATDFPVVTPFQLAPGGGGKDDVFVTKLDATGSAIVYSTYLGGSGDDLGFAIQVDAAGAAYVGGCTTSPNFPTAFPFQATLGNSPPFAYCEDAFVAKLAASGSALVYSSYLGGSGRDEVHGLAVDGNGRAIVAGLTQSADFPTTANVSQAALRGASGQDAFVTSVQADGQTLRFSTFLGSSGTDEANAVAVGPDGHLVVAGMAGSSDFPSSGGAAAQPASGGGIDGFVVKMDNVNSLSKILYATYLGGGGMDWADAVATDSAGNVYVAGVTTSANLPLVRAVQSVLPGSAAAFVSKLRTEAGPFLFSSYLGGGNVQQALGVTAGAAGAMVVTGTTSSADFPLVMPFQSGHGGGQDGFVTRLQARTDVRITMSDAPDPVAVNGTLTYTIAVTNLGPDAATNVRVTDTLPSGTTLLSAATTQGSCSGTTTVTCALGTLDTTGVTVTVRVRPTTTGTRSNVATVTRAELDPVSSNNSATVSTLVGYPLTVSVVRLSGATGTVSSSPAGIACGTDCTEAYASGTTVRLTATPGGTSTFQGWSGACTGTGTCLLSMSASKSVTATFRPVQ